MEIEMFFAKYDTDGDGVFRWDKKDKKMQNKTKMILLSWEEGAQIVEDLENDKIDQVESLDPIYHCQNSSRSSKIDFRN